MSNQMNRLNLLYTLGSQIEVKVLDFKIKGEVFCIDNGPSQLLVLMQKNKNGLANFHLLSMSQITDIEINSMPSPNLFNLTKNSNLKTEMVEKQEILRNDSQKHEDDEKNVKNEKLNSNILLSSSFSSSSSSSFSSSSSSSFSSLTSSSSAEIDSENASKLNTTVSNVYSETICISSSSIETTKNDLKNTSAVAQSSSSKISTEMQTTHLDFTHNNNNLQHLINKLKQFNMPHFDKKIIEHREQLTQIAFNKKKDKIGIGVSLFGQKIFDKLYHAIGNANWQSNIISFDEGQVTIEPPYTSDCVKGHESPIKERVLHVLSILENENKQLLNSSQ